ncbi:MAG: valine--tRNA ligase [Alphaproteobacteria bacterium]|nr:valine--tRNA ligase [Alphaproteobacteria bacterium]
MKKLPDRYDAKTREKFWQNYWREQGVYAFKNDKAKSETFVIDTPPPTVSGLLHMGHVFSYTQADFVARFWRMSGKDVFYPMGFDDNGLPTERLVEKIIGKKAGVYEHENGHGSFVKKCREEVEAAEKEFEALFNEVALSVDWSQKYQTISPESQKISQASFVDLWNKKLVEKKFEPVFWDISDRTALAQADLIDKEVEGMMNYIEFEIEDERCQTLKCLTPSITIMTTRPELLSACVAVMVHPDDERYKKFHGKNAITPLFGVKVKIIADDLVQLDKGTGAVMCCTFGDETDIRWWKKHGLELKIIIGKDGKIDGMPLKQFKEKVIEDLKTQNILQKQEPIKRAVKCAERSGVPIEILVVPQWFIKILDKKDLLKAKAAECNWHPDYMKVRIDHWIDGLSWDWCISRQRFFGVKFPVWYSKRAGEEGKILVADVDQLPCDPEVDLPRGYSRDEVIAETDIMDTWATSSISPQLSSKGISSEISFNHQRHEKLFPADLRPQAHEIIRSWAFYTIVKAALHQNSIPWKNLMISGWCLAADKTKMSKSKGNVVTPTALIEEKGSDIVRYWASTSHLGADTAYSEEVFKIGQKLTTKLFNAAKFASMNFDLLQENAEVTEASDLWILSRLHQTVTKATAEFEKFEYARAREAIEEFFWKDFCDNYLEICKVRSYGLAAEKLVGVDLSDAQKKEIEAKQQSAIVTLRICLETILKLFAPFIPHVCEEIYSTLFDDKNSIHARGNWPKVPEKFFNQKYLEIGEAALAVIFEVRKFKSEKNISMKTTVKKLVINCVQDLSEIAEDLANVCNAEELEFVNSGVLVEVIHEFPPYNS